MTSVFSFCNQAVVSGLRRIIGAVSVAGLVLMVSACSGGPAPTTYDLSAATTGVKARLSGQIVIALPTALQALSEQKIVARDMTGAMTVMGGGQWADQLPNLLQARMINSFENASTLRAVALPSSGVISDYQLVTDIRSFYVVTPGNEAVVELSVRLISSKTGRISRAKLFTARRMVVGEVNAGSVAVTLNEALQSVLAEIVRWVG